jgi:hypothetical protein
VSKKSTLDRIQIPNPCFADWERMVGSQNIRFCTECNKHVYNLSGMTRGEAEALIASAPRGRLCARLTRKMDGTTVTKDDRPGVQLIWRRASPIANAVVSAMLTIATPSVAAAGQATSRPASLASALGRPNAMPDTQGSAAALSGTLLDQSGAVIAGAKLTLTNEGTGESQTTTSSDEGAFRFFVLTEGAYSLKAESVGFRTVENSGYKVRHGQELRIDITMEAGAVSTTGGLIAAPVLPLRELYKDSDRIVVARVGESERVELKELENKDDGTLIIIALVVSSTLKGEGDESALRVYQFVYGDQDETFKPGDNLLVFLRRATIESLSPPDGYWPVDLSRGVKKLSDSDLSVYTQRVFELSQIAGNKPDQEALVEWLVRCAEDPATRWEGAFDLASSAADLRASCSQDDSDEDSDSSQEPNQERSDEPQASIATVEPMPETRELGDRLAFAALLTADQKERLMKALLAAEKITEGDEALIELAADFHDPRLLPFLVSQLHRVEANPPQAAYTIVRVVAQLLNDRQINVLSENYRDASDDDEQEDQDSGKATSAAARERSALMRKFLEQVERKMRE